MRKNTLVIIILILFLSSIAYIFIKQKNTEVVPVDTSEITETSTPVKHCFSRTTIATKETPYFSTDYIQLTSTDKVITGTKFGFQSGPGVSYGFTGVLKGTELENILTLDYSYIVEGSRNTEREIYKRTGTTIERMQYPLIEGKGILLPDTTKTPQKLPYVSISCEEFDAKLPK